MPDREVLARRFNALMTSISTSKRYQTMPNLSADDIRRFQARVDRDVAEEIKLHARLAGMDMGKTAGTVGRGNYGVGLGEVTSRGLRHSA
jgi:hypothetical protein